MTTPKLSARIETHYGVELSYDGFQGTFPNVYDAGAVWVPFECLEALSILHSGQNIVIPDRFFAMRALLQAGWITIFGAGHVIPTTLFLETAWPQLLEAKAEAIPMPEKVAHRD